MQSRPELRLLRSLLTAQGYEQRAGPCEVVGHSGDDAEGFRTLALYVSQSTEGPQGAEAVVYWTDVLGPTATVRR